ncbi:rRNA pseudouridine synthase [bacterium]|nr:rRNA pseudouridine synthase [bacterium]
MSGVRVQKILADLGIASRRKAEEFIQDGEVTINGKIAKLGDKADPDSDHIKFRGKLLTGKAEKKVVVVLFKPRGILPNRPAEQVLEKDTIFDLIPKIKQRVFPVGRLDTDSEGLMLLTNDGKLSQRLLQSKYEIPKIYEVKVDGHLAEKKLDRLSSGKMRIEGKKIKPCKISNVRNTEGKQWLKVQTTEVQNRIVRKMVESLGHPIDKLRRYSFGNVNLSGMVRGQYRYLNLEEIKELKKWVGL